MNIWAMGNEHIMKFNYFQIKNNLTLQLVASKICLFVS